MLLVSCYIYSTRNIHTSTDYASILLCFPLRNRPPTRALFRYCTVENGGTVYAWHTSHGISHYSSCLRKIWTHLNLLSIHLKWKSVLLLFLTFSALVASPKKLLYTVANPARGLLNREKKKKKKSGSAFPPPPPPRAARSEGKKKKLLLFKEKIWMHLDLLSILQSRGKIVVVFFTLTDRASTIPCNIRGCQSGYVVTKRYQGQ